MPSVNQALADQAKADADYLARMKAAAAAAAGTTKSTLSNLGVSAGSVASVVVTTSNNSISTVAHNAANQAAAALALANAQRLQLEQQLKNASLGSAVQYYQATKIIPTYTNGQVSGYAQQTVSVPQNQLASIQQANEQALISFANYQSAKTTQVVNNVTSDIKTGVVNNTGLGGGNVDFDKVVLDITNSVVGSTKDVLRDLGIAAGSTSDALVQAVNNNTSVIARTLALVEQGNEQRDVSFRNWFNGVVGNVPQFYGLDINSLKEIMEANGKTNKSFLDDFGDTISDVINDTLLAGLDLSLSILDTAGDTADTVIDESSKAAKLVASELIEQIEIGANKLGDFINEKVTGWSNELTDTFTHNPSILFKLLQGDYDDIEVFYSDVEKQGGDSGLMRFAFSLLVAIPTLTTAFFKIGAPNAEKLLQLANASAEPTLLSPDMLVNSLYRGLMSDHEYNVEMSLHGVSDDRADIASTVSRPMLVPDEIRQLFLRGDITDQERIKRLERYGFTANDIKKIKELYYVLPSPNDLILMAVREVFTPDVAARFGLFEDLPQEFIDEAKRVGLSSEWASRYWAAHWQLPSPQMGFEMYHRRIIDYADLQLLLKSLDYMPYWRDKLIELSYRPLTRVDVRRMYRLGVLTETEVYEAYLDDGYSPQRAEQMKQFTILYESQVDDPDGKDVRDLTRSVIIEAYNRNELDASNARQRLETLGYTPNDANMIIRVADYKKYVDYTPDRTKEHIQKTIKMVTDAYYKRLMPKSDVIDILVSVGYTQQEAVNEIGYIDTQFIIQYRAELSDKIKELYFENTYTDVEVVDLLIGNGFDVNEANSFVAQFAALKKLRTAKPTKAELRKFLLSGIIDMQEFITQLRGLNYDDKYVQWYLADVGIKMSEDL